MTTPPRKPKRDRKTPVSDAQRKPISKREQSPRKPGERFVAQESSGRKTDRRDAEAGRLPSKSFGERPADKSDAQGPGGARRPFNQRRFVGRTEVPTESSEEVSDAPNRDEPTSAYAKLDKIAGLPAVSAVFRRDPQRVVRLYYESRMKAVAGSFCSTLARWHRPYRMVEPEELARVAGTVLHGGIVAATTPRTINELDFSAAEEWADAKEPLIILDGVGNPHNVGAIARTLAFFGVRRVLLSDHPEQAGLSDAAYRIAEGGLDELEIYRVSKLSRALKRLQAHFQIVGTDVQETSLPVFRFRPDERPIALVFGNEEHGLTPTTAAACEVLVNIPGGGSIQSLNVSASAAIFAYELFRKRAAAGGGDAPDRSTGHVKRQHHRGRSPSRSYREV